MKQCCFLLSLLLITILAQDTVYPPQDDQIANPPQQQPTTEETPIIPPQDNTKPDLSNPVEDSPPQEEDINTTTANSTSFKDLQYDFSFSIKPIDVVFIASIVLAIMLIIATIASFSKVPVKKGYQCRCCQRFKWFIIIMLYLIFSPFLLVYYSINGIVGCLNGCFPDKKLEDCKLDEAPDRQPEPPKAPEQKNKDKYHNFVDEPQQGNQFQY